MWAAPRKRRNFLCFNLWLIVLAFSFSYKNYANFKSYLPFYMVEFYNSTSFEIGKIKFFIFAMRSVISWVMMSIIYRFPQFNTFYIFFTCLCCGIFAFGFSIFPSLLGNHLFVVWFMFAMMNNACLLYTSPSPRD